MRCPDCKGRGKEDCTNCSSGKVYEHYYGGGYKNRLVNCYSCGGHWRGAFDCTRCHGSGQIDAQYDRVVFIQNCYSRKNLDLRNWNESNGASLQLWTFTKDTNQQWHILPAEQYSPIVCIASVFNSKNIDLADGNTGEGAQIQMWEKGENNPNQLWKLTRQDDNSYTIQSMHSDLFLGLSGYNRAIGAIVNLQHWSGELSQRWLIHNVQ